MRTGTARRVALLLSFCSCAHAPQRPTLDRISSALQLPSVNGIAVPSELRGRVVLVNFFATWCFPCIGVLGLLQQLESKYAGRGFLVLAVGMDLEGAEVLEPFARQYQLSFPVLVADERMHRGETPLGVITSLPSTVLYGKDGQLITAFTGVPVSVELEELIARAVGQR